ncbi:hypothetical protein Bca4012_035711 [Brassica carinata]
MSSRTRSKKQEPPSLIPSLTEDIILDILARVPSCYHPILSLVSKHFRSLVASHELEERRSLLGCTEHRLYVVLYNTVKHIYQLYILRRKANGSHRLVRIPSLPNMPADGILVTAGSRIYVFGRLNSVISIDFRSQTVHLLPIQTQMWEPEKTTPEMMSGCMVMMAGKMYTRDGLNSFVYDPKESRWETDKTLNMFEWDYGCVVDDVLYYYDYHGSVFRAYNPKECSWVVVNGLENFVAQMRLISNWFYIGSYGGKLAMFFWNTFGTRVIRCAEISLERRQGKEIWGKVEWCDDVLFHSDDLFVTQTVDVIL